MIEMKVVGCVGIKEAAITLYGNFAQEARRRELIQRIVDSGHRNIDTPAPRFGVQRFRRHMPVTIAKQDFGQRQALPCGSQTQVTQSLCYLLYRCHFRLRLFTTKFSIVF